MKTMAPMFPARAASQSGSPHWVTPALVAVGLGLAFWPVWRWYVLRLDDGSDEPMGLLVLAAAGGFLWRDRRELALEKGSLLVAAIGLLLYALSFPFLPALVRAILSILILGAAFRIDRVAPGIWGLLLLSLPVIATAQFYAGWPIRQLTAAGVEGVLTFLGMSVSRSGTVLWWQGQPVGMDAPCSGIRMLWTGLAWHFVLAAYFRIRIGPLVILTIGAVLLILLANGLRAGFVFLKESGALGLPSWTHEGMGLFLFAGAILLLVRVGDRFGNGNPKKVPPANRGFSLSHPAMSIFALAVLVAAAAPLGKVASAATPAGSSGNERNFPGWPTEWEGRDLIPVELTESEKSFAGGFPGKIAVFRTTEGPESKRLLLRWVEQPTRKLHSSADCLKASGIVVEPEPSERHADGGGDHWAVWRAFDPVEGTRFRVRERLWEEANPEREWAEVSAWYWSAALGRSTGPWWAVTVMEPEEVAR